MPPTLLDSQFATLEEPTPDENAIVVSVVEPPHRIVKSIVIALESLGGIPPSLRCELALTNEVLRI